MNSPNYNERNFNFIVPTFSTVFSKEYKRKLLPLPMSDRRLEICKKKLSTFSTGYHQY
jgi:hypothetical protein